MGQKLKRHFYPIVVIGGVTAGCIYTGNWLPFFIVFGVFTWVGIIVGIVYIFANRKRNVDIYIVEDNRHYVPDERFERDKNETLH